MGITSKRMTTSDSEQVLQYAFNEEDRTIAMGGFVSSKLGHKITRSDIDAVTEDYSYYDGATLLYTLRIIYTDATREALTSVERIA